MKPRYCIVTFAASMLLISVAAMAKDFSESQMNVFLQFATVTEIAKRCPIYKVNNLEFGVWSDEVDLTVEDVNSEYAKVMVMAMMLGRSKTFDQMTPVRVCTSAWEKYGVDGDTHPSLLLKR